jgi:hypothetical protein
MKGFGNIKSKSEKKQNQIETILHDLSITRSARREGKKSYDDDMTAMTGECSCASLTK